jgi:hypothetical protein
MHKYPIGIQNFQELREGGYVYVDKTQYFHQLATTGKYYFLSRPRRFGKSLMISTFQALFEGKKQLFKGLWIEDKWNFEETNPTIVFYFNEMQIRGNDLDKVLVGDILKQAKNHGIEFGNDLDLYKTKSAVLFNQLISKLHEKTGKKVVILIDEYDKPIVDFLDEIEKAEAHRDILKSFYGILKPNDEHIKFLIFTGVSKFAKVSVFSDLNHLDDITLDEKYSGITGITQNELEETFKEELKTLPILNKTTEEDFYNEIKRWYNGYSWLGESVYNPFSLLNFFSKNGTFQNFWFSTGTPTWLIKQVMKRKEFDFDNFDASQSDLDTFQIEDLNPTALLFQTGYLTIKSYSRRSLLYTMGYPNQEVRTALTDHLLQAYRGENSRSVLPYTYKLSEALESKDLDRVFSIINTVYSTLPYDLWQKENERFYHAILHLTFSLLGTYIQSEIHTAEGRCDAIVQTEKYIYAFEFKIDKSPQEALEQIKKRGYLKPYQESGKELISVGVNFSKKLKGVESWLVEQ